MQSTRSDQTNSQQGNLAENTRSDPTKRGANLQNRRRLLLLPHRSRTGTNPNRDGKKLRPRTKKIKAGDDSDLEKSKEEK
jgi:hypothetical protein